MSSHDGLQEELKQTLPKFLDSSGALQLLGHFSAPIIQHRAKVAQEFVLKLQHALSDLEKKAKESKV